MGIGRARALAPTSSVRLHHRAAPVLHTQALLVALGPSVSSAAHPHGTRGGAQAVVEYGSSWCAHCQEIFPHFYRLSGQARPRCRPACGPRAAESSSHALLAVQAWQQVCQVCAGGAL